MRYAAAITLYNPKPDVIDNLIIYTDCFSLVVVNDNSRDNSAYVDRLKKIPSILYIWDGNNWGLPVAFNRSMNICANKDIDFICTLDQDSRLSPMAIRLMKQFLEKQRDSDVALVAPCPVGTESSEKRKMEIERTMDVTWAICSGCFINIKLIKEKRISYDEAYFIDRFDADFGKQIHRHGLRQLLLIGVTMPHVWGDSAGHSALRHYYMFRNRLYYNDKYYSKEIALFRTVLQTVRHCWRIMRHEKDCCRKIRMLPLAIKDYRKNLLGEVSKDTLEKIKKYAKNSI